MSVASDLESALADGGEMGARVATFEWDRHPFGPMEQWPQRLRALVATMMRCPFPMHVTWGPELRQIYNDGYKALLGYSKHPALGERLDVTFAEVFESFTLPRIRLPLEQRRAYVTDDDMVPLQRHGWVEETHFAFSYSPLDDDDGVVRGVVTICMETTEQVLDTRRLATLSTLSVSTSGGATLSEVLPAAVDTIAASVDTPAAAVVELSEDGCRVLASNGFDGIGDALPLDESFAATCAQRFDRGLVPVGTLGLRPRHHRAWIEPPMSCRVIGFGDHALVVAVHPGLLFDGAFERYVRLVVANVAAGVDRVRSLVDHAERLAALRELDAAKDALISDVSHELRTPLTVVSGLHDELLESPDLLDREGRGLVEVAERNVDRLRRLVDSLLAFGKMSAGRLNPELAPADLAAVTRSVCDSFSNEFRRAGLRLDVEVHDTGVVSVDVGMWETVVSNLLSNAFKFTLDGEVRVRLVTGADTVSLIVSDTGIGIPPEHLDRLFERFHRVRQAEARVQEGTGIGLALVDRIVRVHHGGIEVDSVVGEGTTFTVWIPRRADDAATDAGVTNTASVVAEGGRLDPDVVVLVVEDSDDLRLLMERSIGRRCVVVSATNGREALDVLDRRHVDVVVTDAMMPVMNGFELMDAMAADPDLATVPVVLMTGLGGVDAPGAAATVSKPFRVPDLLEIIASVASA